MTKPDTNRVRALLGPFVDAGTTLQVREVGGGRLEVSGKRQLQKFSFLVGQGEDGQLWVPKKRGEVPLGEHLASSFFADMDGLARGMIPFLKSRLRDTKKIIDGRVASEGGLCDRSAGDAVSEAFYAPPILGTTVTFLHGDAGAGKSWLLMNLAFEQASNYLQRRRGTFPLYVDAQGVNLRSISQQIAHQLDVYNGVLRYPEVTPLVRLGMLGLIVDGFDELIMPSGYNDTVRALLSYIDEFKGEGAIVASARTSFIHAYTETPLKNEPVHPYVFQTLSLCPWTSEERSEYLRQHGREDLRQPMEQLVSAAEVNRELLGRPFLVAHVFGLLRDDVNVDPVSLVSAIEDAFIERERTEKLEDLDTGQPLLSRLQFDQLLAEVAEEMWLLRQNSLDRQTARTVAGLVAESFQLTRSERELIEARIDTHAFLESEGDFGDRVRFPHEILFSRVLARRILCWLKEEDFEKLRSFLRIAPLKVSMAEQFVDLVPREPKGGAARQVLDQLNVGAKRVPKSDYEANVKLNLGTLVAYVLPLRRDRRKLHLEGLFFSGVAFDSANLASVVFEGCVLHDVDARGADWRQVAFQDCAPVSRLFVDEGQRFPASLPPVAHLRVFQKTGGWDDIYGTRPTREALFGKEVDRPRRSELSGDAREALSVLTGLCKKIKLGRHWFPSAPEEDAAFRNLSRERQWGVVLDLLEEHGLLTREKRQRSGPSAELCHVRRAPEILAVLGGDRGAADVQSLVEAIRQL